MKWDTNEWGEPEAIPTTSDVKKVKSWFYLNRDTKVPKELGGGTLKINGDSLEWWPEGRAHCYAGIQLFGIKKG